MCLFSGISSVGLAAAYYSTGEYLTEMSSEMEISFEKKNNNNTNHFRTDIGFHYNNLSSVLWGNGHPII